MGQNVHGLPYGMAAALNEIQYNTTRKKYRTEDDYYNEMVRRGRYSGFANVTDPRLKRLVNRARDRFKKDFPREYSLKSVSDMLHFLIDHSTTELWQHVGKDVERHNMATRAIELYQLGKNLID